MEDKSKDLPADPAPEDERDAAEDESLRNRMTAIGVLLGLIVAVIIVLHSIHR